MKTLFLVLETLETLPRPARGGAGGGAKYLGAGLVWGARNFDKTSGHCATVSWEANFVSARIFPEVDKHGNIDRKQCFRNNVNVSSFAQGFELSSSIERYPWWW